MSEADLLEQARELLPDVIALRRRIHQNPELGLHTTETRDAVLAALADLDLEWIHSRETSGVVGTLRGRSPGPGILLRADTDALPMPEDTGLPYASRCEGRMHACGHDAHTAMLAGAARLLADRRETLAGSVPFLFQPGEESWFGALRILDEGLLDALPELRATFAIHVDPGARAGSVASRPGPILSAADIFSIEVRGRGGHASMPHQASDPIPAACEIVLALQSMVTRRIDAWDPVVLSVTQLEAGTTTNVIPESARILGTLRSASERSRRRAQEGLRRVARQVAAAHELEAEVHVVDGYPATVNDEGFHALLQATARSLVGEDAVQVMPAPLMGAEDFSYLLQRYPGALAFLGVRVAGPGRPAPAHSNRMLLDEDALATGIALHAAVALRYLRDGSSDPCHTTEAPDAP